jgi:1-acyl-sn-glycerol-3-phosphate acyltransferase
MSRPIKRPRPLPALYRWRTNLLQAPLFGLGTIFCGSASLLFSLWDKSGRQQHAIARIWARFSLWTSFSRLRVVGKENLTAYPVAVYASNHTSYMDTPVIFEALPFQFRILARIQLWAIPFIGWYLNRSGQLPIDTSNPRATITSLGNAVKALKAGMSIFVFPEGGRTPNGKLKPFLSGASFLAIRAQVPLVPMALHGVYDLLPQHAHHFYPSNLTLSVGKPISTVGLNHHDSEALTEQLRGAIQALYDAIETPDIVSIQSTVSA